MSRSSHRSERGSDAKRADDGRRLPFAGKRRLFNVVKVRFPRSHKAADCDAGALYIHPDTPVVVRTRRGLKIGRSVGMRFRKVLPPDTMQPVVRLATASDLARSEQNDERERDALREAIGTSRDLGLEMKFVAAEYALDRKRLTLYFSADGRVDFRKLVRTLARSLRTRIEMHQVGLRHGAGMLGGIGSCGRELCCSTFLDDFEPVAIRMVKDQGLTLNPKKVSGMCGRLMCCLVYEHSAYVRGRKRLPRRRNRVRTRHGLGRVRNVDVVQESVEVKHDDGLLETYPIREVILKPDDSLLEAIGDEPIPPTIFTIDGVVLEPDRPTPSAEPPSSRERRSSRRRRRDKRGQSRRRKKSGRSGEQRSNRGEKSGRAKAEKKGDSSRRRRRRRRRGKGGKGDDGSSGDDKATSQRGESPSSGRDTAGSSKADDGKKPSSRRRRRRRKRKPSPSDGGES